MADLRQRRHQQTRSDIVQHAFALFAAHGYGRVTMEAIASTAGVSRSTAYRRFPTKELIVLEVARQWLEVFDEAVESIAPDASLLVALESCCEAVAAHIDANLDRTVAAYELLKVTPSLQASGVATPAWNRRMVALIDRYGSYDTESNEVIAGAYLGGIDAVMFNWGGAANRTSVLDSIRRMLQLLRPVIG